MASIAFTAEPIDIGRIVSRAFGVIGRNPVLYFGLALVLLIVPGAAVRLAFAPTLTPGAMPNPAAMLPYTLGSAMLGVLLNLVAQAIVTHATVTDLNGERPSFSACLRIALPLIFPLLGLGLIEMFGLALGFALLFVPGVVLAMMWSVAVPALVEERQGVFASLGRSRALTKGSRWRLLALFIIAGIVVEVPVLLISTFVGGLQATSATGPGTPAGLLIGAISGLGAMLLATIVASTFVELRTVREGATPASLAAVFD